MVNHRGLSATIFGKAQERLHGVRNLPWSSIGAVIARLVSAAETKCATGPDVAPVELS